MEGFIKDMMNFQSKEIWLVDIEDGKEKLKSLVKWHNVCGMLLLMMLKFI